MQPHRRQVGASLGAVPDEVLGEMLHSGPHSVVRRGPDPDAVTKFYRPAPHRTAREAAEVEFARMRQLHAVLSGTPGVNCPRPLRWGEDEGRWYLVMEELVGSSLLTLMHRRDRPDPRVVASQLHEALEAYAEVLGAPHYGLKPQDVIVDTATGEIGILDFEPCSKDRYLAGIGDAAAPAAVSAALLLGLTLHLAAAPHMLRRGRAADWLVTVGVEALRQPGVDRPDELAEVVRAVYRKRYEKGDVWWRRLWYQIRWVDVGRPAMRRAGLGTPRPRQGGLPRVSGE